MTLRQRFNLLIESLDKGTIEERKHMVMRWIRDFTTEEYIPEDVFADAPQAVLEILLFSFTTQLLQTLMIADNNIVKTTCLTCLHSTTAPKG